MKLSQFDLISTPTGNETTLRNRGTATRNHADMFFGTQIHSTMDKLTTDTKAFAVWWAGGLLALISLF
jgi:hypothetical protein